MFEQLTSAFDGQQNWLSPNDWMRVVTTLSNMTAGDTTVIMNSITQLINEVMRSLDMVTSTSEEQSAIMNEIRDQMVGQQAFMELLLQQLSNIEKQGNWFATVSDLMKMPSMKRVANELENSPEILRVILHTFSTAAQDPSKTSALSAIDWTSACQNPSNLKDVFVVPQGSTVDIQSVINAFCELSTVDPTKLMQELEAAVKGLSSFLEKVLADDWSQSPFKWSDIVDTSTKFSSLIERLLNKTMNGEIGVFLPGFSGNILQDSQWQNIWMEFITNMENATNQYMDVERSLNTFSSSLNSALAGLPMGEMGVMYGQMEKIMNIINAQLKPFVGASVKLDDYLTNRPETAELMEQMGSMPVLMKVFFITSQKEPIKLNNAMTDIATICYVWPNGKNNEHHQCSTETICWCIGQTG